MSILRRVARTYIKPVLVRRHQRALVSELRKLPIADSGTKECGGKLRPFVTLDDGTFFWGQTISEHVRRMESYLAPVLPQSLSRDVLQVGIDIVNRYLYPHAMPGRTPPYNRKARQCMHPQHRETIADLHHLSASDREGIQQRFEPSDGEILLDVGAYMGYGTMRMAREIGTFGHIYAIEADPDNVELLQLNLEANNLTDRVTVLHRAIWSNDQEVLPFHKTDHQRNSLIRELVDEGLSVDVASISIDSIVRQFSLSQVDAISVTVNGAEVEALHGMKETVAGAKTMRISSAGWYERDGQKIWTVTKSTLESYGLTTEVTDGGAVFAWKNQ